MAKKIYITSIKGGTGVSSCAAGLGFALAAAGERTLIADGDVYYGGGLIVGGYGAYGFGKYRLHGVYA